MAENNDATQLEEAKKNAVAELKSLQAEKGWNDEKIKEYTDAINGMSSLKDIEEYLEARRKEEKKENENEGREDDKPKEEENDVKPAEENKELTPEERKAAREEQVPTDEFKEFMEKQYGEGAFDKHYVHGPDEEKDRFEIQYEAITKKSPLRKPESTTIHEIDEIEKPENVNTDDSHADEPEWKKMRREAWEKYAADNQQEFKLLSEDKAPDLSMSVGDTPIKYADEHNISMGNGEYGKFLKAVEIEKNAKTDVINFGKIESEEYKAKLAAACIQMGMRMKNGPKSIDLSLDCFKNLDDATKAKIEEYNQKQAERENNTEKPKEETRDRDEKPAEENKYKKLFDDKVKEFADKKAKGESFDFSQIKDPVERVVAYAAAKESKLKIENLGNYENLVDPKLDEKAKAEVAAARAALPENSQNHLKARETWEQKLVEIKGRLKNKEQRRGQYHDKDGNLVDSKLSVHDKDGKLLQNVERNKVEYKIETQENGQKKKTYERDDAGLFKLRQQRDNGGR